MLCNKTRGLFICAIFVSTLMAAPPELKVSGKYFQTVSGGSIVRLVGVNICGCEWSAASYGPPSGFGGDMVQSVNAAITTWKSNCVRIPLNQDFWFGYSNGSSASSNTQNTSYGNRYRADIDDVINAASEKNVYVELDLHWSGTGAWGSSVSAKQQNMPDDHSTDFWQDVATRYKNNPAVLFNLYNEPKDDSWAIWKNGGQSGSGFHTPGHQSLVNTIRATGANNVIIAGGLGWAYDMTGVKANALSDPSGNGIAYEAHIYDNKGPGAPGIWNNNVTVAVNAGFCVVIGEFGPKNDGTQDNSGCTPFESDLISWIDGANPANYPYSALGWSFNTDAVPRMIADWNFNPTSCHGAQIKSWLASVKPVSIAPAAPRGRAPAAPPSNAVLFDVSGKKIKRGGTPGSAGPISGVYLYGQGTVVRRVVMCR
jgi:endoglucanase